MLAIGDYVVFVRDGTRGLVIAVEENRYQIMWEDTFISWEQREALQKT
ncbi:hypothetical protein [Brevibacillus migulae]|nr:hypothetical protein [Brevibacillus migulae]